MRNLKNLSFCVILLELLAAANSVASEYEIVDLGTLGGPWSIARGINDSGQVVGNAATATGQYHAFLWTEDGGMQDLGTLGGQWSTAWSINESRQVVGDAATTTGQYHAFLWTNGVMQDLGNMDEPYSEARGINDSGQVVGSSFHTSEAESRAFLWTADGGMQDLGTLGGPWGKARGINDSGQVVGDATTATGQFHAFLWTNGVMQDLGTLEGDLFSIAFGINDSGQVVGYSFHTSEAESRAFLWTADGGMQDLGTMGGISNKARDINDSGQVVGTSYHTADSYIHAFLWTEDGGMQDLGTLGGSDSYANGINNSGQVVGLSDTASGPYHACIWITAPPLPPNEDVDNDGLLNGWEINGLDENGNGTIDLDLPTLGADPMHKDLFVEVDAMVGRAPTQAALNRVVAAFAAVPNSLVDNPDGMDGITLHIQLDETNIPLADWPNAFDDFDDVKDNRFGTAAQREDANWSNIENAKAEVYRYCIFANRYRWVYPNGNVTWSSSGLGEYPGNDFMVTLGEAWGGTEDQQVGTFMHEFGHNLNLHHGGNDGINFKPNYHSIMNYHWQMPNSNHTGWGLDYSREVLPTLNESNLDESVGIGGAAGVTVPVGPLRPNGMPWIVSESGPVDWNHNGNWDTGVNADINYVRANVPAEDGGPSPGQVLTGHNDWPVLWYRLSGHPNFQDGVHIDIPEEITYEVYREVYGPRINAGLDFDPDVLNLGSQGQFITTYIELPQGYNVSNIDISSLMLNISVPALSKPVGIGDYDSDGINDLMVKFDRQEVTEILEPGEQLVYVTGRLSDGTSLTGDEIIWVLPTKGVE